MWRRRCDAAIVFGSVVPAFVWGVALANIVRGVPIDADFEMVGSLADLFNPYAVLGGLVTTSVFLVHGAVFVGLKTVGDIRDRARTFALRSGVVAALLRLSVGSATVAAVTAASIMAPILTSMPDVNRDLMVVAVGAGSLIASHVNDGGFWLVKEYFNMTVPQTVKTWTVLETIVSVLGLVGLLALSLTGL